MLIETNPCESCDFTPSICDGDIEICQLTKGQSKPVSSGVYEQSKIEQYQKEYVQDCKKELSNR